MTSTPDLADAGRIRGADWPDLLTELSGAAQPSEVGLVETRARARWIAVSAFTMWLVEADITASARWSALLSHHPLAFSRCTAVLHLSRLDTARAWSLARAGRWRIGLVLTLSAGPDGKRRYTVAQIAAEFGVTRRPTIYRHLRCPRRPKRPAGRGRDVGRCRIRHRVAGEAAAGGAQRS
jgi:hypothetical protein